MKIDIPSLIIKDRVSDRFTLIGEDGYRVLREYLSLREHIDDENLIFQAQRKDKDRNEVLSRVAMSKNSESSTFRDYLNLKNPKIPLFSVTVT